jgi:hypothetical protein
MAVIDAEAPETAPEDEDEARREAARERALAILARTAPQPRDPAEIARAAAKEREEREWREQKAADDRFWAAQESLAKARREARTIEAERMAAKIIEDAHNPPPTRESALAKRVAELEARLREAERRAADKRLPHDAPRAPGMIFKGQDDSNMIYKRSPLPNDYEAPASVAEIGHNHPPRDEVDEVCARLDAILACVDVGRCSTGNPVVAADLELVKEFIERAEKQGFEVRHTTTRGQGDA